MACTNCKQNTVERPKDEALKHYPEPTKDMNVEWLKAKLRMVMQKSNVPFTITECGRCFTVTFNVP